jgi:hypothetical protein
VREYIIEARATFRGRVRITVHADDPEHARQLVYSGRFEDMETIDDGSKNEPEVDCSELEVRVAE